MSQTVNIDDLYDRQVRTFGIDSIKNFNSSSVYIFNICETSNEVIKNLALMGVKNIFIPEFDHVEMNSFYYNDKYNHNDIIKYINELNPSINIQTYKKENDEIKNSIIVIINHSINRIKSKYDEMISNNNKIIMGWCDSKDSCIFVDVGDSHTISVPDDNTFEDIKIIRIINNTVYVEPNYLEENDIITFNQLEGECDYLISKEFNIFNVQKDSFQIDLLEKVNLINGFVRKVIKPQTISHKRIDESMDKIISFDYDKSKSIINELVFNENNIETIYPIISVIGSIIANEVIKIITCKYTPINQWFEFHDDNIDNISLKEQNIMIIGCGALGCELLKNLTMMGCKNISVTDPDHIETSNLSRQFLFRNKDVKKSKSQVASNYINKRFNDNIVKSYEHKLSNENINIVNSLFEDKNIIINALDNLTARRFVDSVCFEKNKPLFESGTMGMKGNTQPVIPFLTETYSDSIDMEEDKSYPVCTIKNFPNKIEHTIHWARDYFELFNRAFTNILKYKENPNFFDNLSQYDAGQAINDINMFCSKEYDDWTDCLYLVKDIYDKEYYKEIKQLLYCYPKEHQINGEYFWSNGKRCPKEIKHYYSSNTIDFFEYSTKLLCNCMNIDNTFTRKELMQIMLDFRLPDFEPDIKKVIPKNDKEIKNDVIQDTELNTFLFIRDVYYPQEFEKDDDTNYHIKWITSASNCRAELYNIQTVDEFTTKGIAGKIIPAVATTTSLTVGLICLEVLKYVKGCRKISDYKSYFVNLSDNTFIGAEPIECKKIKLGEKEYNKWHKFDYKLTNNITIGNFITYYNDLLDIEISAICCGNSMIYSDIFGKEEDLNKKMLDELNMTEYCYLTLIDNMDNEIPNIKVYL